MRAVRRVLLGAVVAAAVTAAPAGASGWTPVTIDAHALLGQGGTFTATGGVVCPSGTTTDVGSVTGGPGIEIFHVLKTFHCDDATGTFTLKLVAKSVAGAPTDSGTWKVDSGTGAYEALKGSGKLVGTYFPSGTDRQGIDDYFTGKMSIG